MCVCIYIYIYIYIYTYSLYICVYLYIHYVAKSIGSPSSNERFDYFSNLEVPFFSSKEGGVPVLLSI